MKVLPPGNILQNLYLKERINKNKWQTFLEIGAGNGYLSNILLEKGMQGIGCDLNESACLNNQKLNRKYVQNGLYKVYNQNFLSISNENKYDLIISSMVIEHLRKDELIQFVNKCKAVANKQGCIVFLVPSSMKYWGIEDEIAGHIKRYEFEDFMEFENRFNLTINHMAGLTYPLSNWLLSISNRLVKKNESKLLNLNQKEKTISTGNRNVPFKTNFPAAFGLILNEWVLYLLHILQKLFKNNPNSLVIYCELIISK